MPCRREKHVFEVTENVRPDRVAFETRQQETGRSFSIEYIEVIRPEIDEHFLKLPIRVNGAVQLVFDQLRIDQLLWLRWSHRLPTLFRQSLKRLRTKCTHDLPAFFGVKRIEERQLFGICAVSADAYLIGRQQFVQRRSQAPFFFLPFLLFRLSSFRRFFLNFARQAFQNLRGCRSENATANLRIQRCKCIPPFLDGSVEQPARLLRRQERNANRSKNQRWLRIFLSNLPRGEAKRVQRVEFGFKNTILRNLLWMELLIDPLLDAQSAHLFDVARTWSEGQPVQHMHRLFIE